MNSSSVARDKKCSRFRLALLLGFLSRTNTTLNSAPGLAAAPAFDSSLSLNAVSAARLAAVRRCPSDDRMSSTFNGDELAPFLGFIGAASALVFSCM